MGGRCRGPGWVGKRAGPDTRSLPVTEGPRPSRTVRRAAAAGLALAAVLWFVDRATPRGTIVADGFWDVAAFPGCGPYREDTGTRAAGGECVIVLRGLWPGAS